MMMMVLREVKHFFGSSLNSAVTWNSEAPNYTHSNDHNGSYINHSQHCAEHLG